MLTALDEPVLPLVAPPLDGQLCESCGRRRARLVVCWPDTQFEVCSQCAPAPLGANLTDGRAMPVADRPGGIALAQSLRILIAPTARSAARAARDQVKVPTAYEDTEDED